MTVCTCPTPHAATRRIAAHAVDRIDPTRTTVLRNQFGRAATRRLRRLMGEVRKRILEDEDLLTAGDPADAPPLGVGPRRNFTFPRSEQRVRSFSRWLRRRINAGVLEAEVVEGELIPLGDEPWPNEFVRSSYGKGVQNARQEVRRSAPQVAERLGLDTSQDAIRAALTRPIHADRLGLMFSRTFEEMHGVTDAMAQQMRRALVDGMAEGQGARQLARNLNGRVRNIGITRSRMIARTEVVRAHLHGTIREFEAAGVVGVEVRAEILTAADPCEMCEALEERSRRIPFTLDEALELFPVHPNCRCTVIPAVIEDD